MKTTPLISTIIPVHNGRVHLHTAIQSILNQSFKDFELIIINDCSQDNTAEILSHYYRVDPRINIINNKKNLGITKSLNKGLEIAKGKYIARMDGDDKSMPDRFKIQVEFMEKNPDFILCGGQVKTEMTGFDKRKNTPENPDVIKAMLFFDNAIIHPSVMLRWDILKKEGYKYDETMRVAQDYELWVRLAEKYKLVNLPEELLEYRWHESNVSIIKRTEQKQNQFIAKIRQLEKLIGRKVSDEEKILHGLLTDNTEIKEDLPLGELITWSNNLIKLNTDKNIYHPKIFRRIIKLILHNLKRQVM